jgi:site-specific DNA-adenine methylase
VLSDINSGVINLLTIVRDQPKALVSKLSQIEYSYTSFKKAIALSYAFLDPLDQAVNDYTLFRMSRNGQQRAFCWSARKRGNQPSEVNAWITSIPNIYKVAERLQGVEIICCSFEATLIKNQGFVYCNPPVALIELQRAKLKKLLYNRQAMVTTTPNPIYAELFRDWKLDVHEFAGPVYTASWYNYSLASNDVSAKDNRSDDVSCPAKG